MRNARFLAWGLTAVLMMAGCAAGGNSEFAGPLPAHGRALPLSGSSLIQHVVIVVQENRSFDDFFATFPGADGATQGLEKLSSGDKEVPLTEGSLESNSLGHSYQSYRKEYDGGKMDGFNLVTRAIKKGVKVPAGTYSYRYVNPKYIAPYWTIAQNYVLGDHMFTTQGSSSFTGHQDLIAGGTWVTKENSVVDFPSPATWGCNAGKGTVTSLITNNDHYLLDKGPFPCFTYGTLRDLLDAKGISWLYFTNTSGAYVWNAFDAIAAVRNGPEWTTNIIAPETKFFDYVDSGEMPGVSWVIPDAINSDHPGYHSDTGPSWVASIVNAVGQSAYWDSTAIVVVWDDWGGEYDNVAPPQLGAGGLGMRVPFLIISPYARETSSSQPGYIAHTQYEFGSILKFIEDIWGLGRLGSTDKRATSIGNAFDFSQAPRKFSAIPSKYSIQYFKHQKPSGLPVDDY